MFGYKIISIKEYDKLIKGSPSNLVDKLQQLKNENEGLKEDNKALEHRAYSINTSFLEQKEKNLYYIKALNELDAKQARALKLYDTLSEFFMHLVKTS